MNRAYAQPEIDNTAYDPATPTDLVVGGETFTTLTDKICGSVEQPKPPRAWYVAITLTGGPGANTLRGEGGDDRIFYSGGADSWFGGEGTDTLDYSNVTTDVTVNLSAGTATNTGMPIVPPDSSRAG